MNVSVLYFIFISLRFLFHVKGVRIHSIECMYEILYKRSKEGVEINSMDFNALNTMYVGGVKGTCCMLHAMLKGFTNIIPNTHRIGVERNKNMHNTLDI